MKPMVPSTTTANMYPRDLPQGRALAENDIEAPTMQPLARPRLMTNLSPTAPQMQTLTFFKK
jgi:hypothetical protein